MPFGTDRARRVPFQRALILLPLAATAFSLAGQTRPAATPAPKRPKLVLGIVVDQFRYDYLERFRAQYTGGIDRLLRQGAVFTNAHYEHFPTVTAIGHSTFLSGAAPSISGIVGNEWYDRESGKQTTSVADSGTKLLGGSGTGSSPRNLLVSTIADELKMSHRGESRAIGISMKDRSAILPVGRMADGAYWFDDKTGNFVSSTYYFEKPPAWVGAFNDSRAVDKFTGLEWRQIDNPKAEPLRILPAEKGEKYYAALERTPYGNELVEMFAEACIESEKLGQHEATDVLTISFSANDRIGHDYGPDDPRVKDVSIRTDRELAKLFAFLDRKVGLANVLVVYTADHGVAPLPELQAKRRMAGGRVPEDAVLKVVETRLAGLYGGGPWVVGKSGPAAYLNHGLIASRKLDIIQVRAQAADAVRQLPEILRVYTYDQILNGQIPNDQIDRRVRNGFFPQRASDLFIITKPYFFFAKTGVDHGTPHNYDSHVPVIFAGPGVKAGRYHTRIAVNDIAPTLATMLGVETPSGASGRVLLEIFTPGL